MKSNMYADQLEFFQADQLSILQCLGAVSYRGKV